MTHGWLMFRYCVGAAAAEPLEASTSAAERKNTQRLRKLVEWFSLSARDLISLFACEGVNPLHFNVLLQLWDDGNKVAQGRKLLGQN